MGKLLEGLVALIAGAFILIFTAGPAIVLTLAVIVFMFKLFFG